MLPLTDLEPDLRTCDPELGHGQEVDDFLHPAQE